MGERKHGIENGEQMAKSPLPPADEEREQEAAAAKAELKAGETIIVLGDGRIARVGKAKGRHLQEGAAVARDPGNPISLMMGVVAQVTRINGERIVYEDLLDLDMTDVLELIGKVSGNVAVLSRPSAISS